MSEPSDRTTTPPREGPAAEELSPELARLPRGRHGLPREFIVHNQRERLIAGLAEAVAAKGYAATTVGDITREAAVSRRTFYEHFDSKEACFIAAYDVVLAQITEHVTAAFRSQSEWPQAMRAALAALLEFLAREPALARLGMVEGTLAGLRVMERYKEAIDAFIEIFRLGRDISATATPAPSELPPSTEEALVGGIASLITRRILAGETERLTELLPAVVEFALTPYVGVAEAQRVGAKTSE